MIFLKNMEEAQQHTRTKLKSSSITESFWNKKISDTHESLKFAEASIVMPL